MKHHLHASDPPRPPAEPAYDALLRRAKNLSAHSLNRLRQLAQRYPSPPLQDLVAYLQRSHDDPEHERRQSPRLLGQGRVTVSTPEAPTEWTEAQILNRSVSGFCLLLGQEAVVGDILIVWMHEANPEAPWAAVEVRYCRAEQHGWVAGCRFLDLEDLT
jgi:hypothetical protein